MVGSALDLCGRERRGLSASKETYSGILVPLFCFVKESFEGQAVGVTSYGLGAAASLEEER